MTTEQFTNIYQRYYHMAFILCIARVKDYEVARDLTNTVFLKIWEKRTVVQLKKITGFIGEIAINLSIDYIRRRKRYYEIRLDLLAYDGEVENKIMNKFQLQQIQSIIENLPPRQKTIIKMQFFEGIGPGKICEILNLANQTVRNTTQDAIKNIKKMAKTKGILHNELP